MITTSIILGNAVIETVVNLKRLTYKTTKYWFN